MKLELIQIRNLIDSKEKWTKHRLFDIRYDGIESRCVLGAIIKVLGSGSPKFTPIFEMLNSCLPSGVIGPVYRYNDLHSTTHSDMMILIDKAILISPESWSE